MAGACLGRHREHLTPEATRDLPQLILLVPGRGLTSRVLIAFQEGLLPILRTITETRLPEGYCSEFRATVAHPAGLTPVKSLVLIPAIAPRPEIPAFLLPLAACDNR
jgi:hypothetical protein